MATGQSYLDPVYDQYERDAAQRVGIDPSLLRAIRTQGERSNADQVSSAGARSVYQIIPQTRNGIIKNYGFDPYASPQNAVLGAAYVLKEGLQRNHGDVAAAVGEYHGGIDRRNWGAVNSAYRARVTGDGGGPSASTAGALYGVPDDDPTSAMDTLYGMQLGGGSTAPQVSMQPGALSKSMQAQQQTLDSYGAAPQQPTGSGLDFAPWLDNYVKNIVKNA